jgi:magnesium transporter
VNGLVYFDQFSLISPLHLGFVVSGIFVLLGGVWVVTIQSGGGNANSQTWKKDGLNDEEVSAAVNNARDIEGSSQGDFEGDNIEGSGLINIPSRSPSHSARVEVETLPDLMHVPSISTDSIGRGFTQPSRRPSVSSQTSHRRFVGSPERHQFISGRDFATLVSPSRGISRRRRSTVHTSNEPSSSQHPHRTPSFNHTHASYAQISPPLLPFGTASTLGTGFQIGLSPVSPGFAIVPRERGQRSSELGLGAPGFADVVIDATEARREWQRRRTVSEGDAWRGASVSSHSQSGSEHEDGGSLESHADGRTDGNSQTLDNRHKGKARQGNLRWQWLRKVFRNH